MKYNNGRRYIMMGIAIVVSGTLMGRHYPEYADDYRIVDTIKTVSDITKTDVDRWKLLWVGRADAPVAVAAGAYGVLSSAKLLESAHDNYGSSMKNVLKNETLAKFVRVPDSVTDTLTDKSVWAGVGMVGAGFAAYKLLYPRIKSGLVDKIKRYVALCDQLGVMQVWYQDLLALKNDAGRRSQTEWYIGDSVAIYNGLQNLKEQSNYALLLLDLVGGMQEYRKKILSAGGALQHNVTVIEKDVQAEIAQRVKNEQMGTDLRSSRLKEQKAQLDITNAHIKNVTSVWNTLKSVVEFAHKTAEFAEKHPTLTVGAMAGAWWQGSKWFGSKE